jgi:hypothetical protein
MIERTLAGIAGTLGQLPMLTATSAADRVELIKSVGLAMSFSVGWAVLFGALPGFLLISRARQFAEWLESSPGSGPNLEFSMSVLLPVGAILIGTSVAIDGAAGLVAGAVTTVIASVSADGVGRDLGLQSSLSELAHSGVLLASGLALGFWGARTAKNAG